jgi:hypothetical protein
MAEKCPYPTYNADVVDIRWSEEKQNIFHLVYDPNNPFPSTSEDEYMLPDGTLVIDPLVFHCALLGTIKNHISKSKGACYLGKGVFHRKL